MRDLYTCLDTKGFRVQGGYLPRKGVATMGDPKVVRYDALREVAEDTN